ncbi:hypothetical protein TESS_TESS_02506 [Tessaracoccus sp. O5.2]|uniref:Flp pilus assembly protein CpaB n=1 Tax=Tessaracoccus sp. O5.2 TaxID=3157622 RepID=UPI0035EE845A
MRRRVIAAIAATLLTLIGAAMVAVYVVRADERALAQFDPTEVLVATVEIPTGGTLTAGENAELRALPKIAVVTGALTDAEPVSGLVAAAPILPGEQIVPQRFVSRETITGDQVVVPEDLVQVTIVLQPERVLGGKLIAGNTVGIVVSVQPDVGPYESETILHRILVSRVQDVEPVQATDDGEAAPAAAPGAQFITLALPAPDAERVVWGAEHGTLWLTLERETSVIDGTRRVLYDNVWTTEGTPQS